MGVFRVRFKVKTNPIHTCYKSLKMHKNEPKGQCKPQSCSGYAHCRYYGPVSGVDKPERSLSCSRSTHQWRSLGGRGYNYPRRIAEGGAKSLNSQRQSLSDLDTYSHTTDRQSCHEIRLDFSLWESQIGTFPNKTWPLVITYSMGKVKTHDNVKT